MRFVDAGLEFFVTGDGNGTFGTHLVHNDLRARSTQASRLFETLIIAASHEAKLVIIADDDVAKSRCSRVCLCGDFCRRPAVGSVVYVKDQRNAGLFCQLEGSERSTA
jgi:hypothetical protein